MENPMPHLNIPEDTLQRLATKAAALNITVDDLVRPARDQIAETDGSARESPLPLTGDAWLAELAAWKRDGASRVGRYPREFVLDDSRETIYHEREDAQL
jgi:hypothetical protein